MGGIVLTKVTESNDSPVPKTLLVLLVLRLCLPLALIFIGLFGHETLRNTLFQICFGAFLLAGILIRLLISGLRLDWEGTPLLLLNFVLLVGVIVPRLAYSTYWFGIVAALLLFGMAAWIVRRLRGSPGNANSVDT